MRSLDNTITQTQRTPGQIINDILYAILFELFERERKTLLKY